MHNNKPDFYNNLDKIYLKIWDLLNTGLSNRDDPFHIPAFVCGANDYFNGRIVVLRGLDKKNKSLWFHTDIRSNKIKILKENSKANLLFYNKSHKIQLRVSGNAKINYKNNFTEKSWKKLLI